jgi:hypothetical protein
MTRTLPSNREKMNDCDQNRNEHKGHSRHSFKIVGRFESLAR